ncbi:hypothetical protein VQ02_28090 [Methylobacterium variabile]|uniref:DUF3096 domain-containing protein n=1 Tax=Methylobacterium variabile TaxID=298794 RepID=A0A0J6UVW0_9HYPH|nr:hypothetical protein VQ02_28090 [Methylobacterium variabile]
MRRVNAVRPRSAAPKAATMTITIANLQPIIAIVAGVLILIAPRLLNYIVAIYLILAGLFGLGLLR